MLKKWIDEIRAKSNLYKTECWKYHLSGNVIELSILPAYLKQNESYRCSVIAVGQVLNALSKKIEKGHLNFHIQSFPNLESPEIVAAIRTGEKNEFTGNSTWKKVIDSDDQDAISMIYKYAERYQLDVQKADNLSQADPNKEIPFEDYPTWLALYSRFNNPFTWLNIGYLKECLRYDFSNSSKSEQLRIIDFCSINTKQYPNLKVPENKFIQSLIGIRSMNM
ncbi:MAG: hypothetical protein U5K72_00205 [Balneolaceae bacterium]|nr:hypothetical protein [Balneolaceae bacterium]